MSLKRKILTIVIPTTIFLVTALSILDYIAFHNYIIDNKISFYVCLNIAFAVFAVSVSVFVSNIIIRPADRMIIEYMKKSNNTTEELRILNEKLQRANSIIEKSPVVVFEWSTVPGTPDKFVTQNISLYGYTQEDFYSRFSDYWDFVYEEDREVVKQKVWDARKQGLSEYKHTYRVICKNGQVRWVEEWLFIERDSNGVNTSEKGILRDITEQKLAEEKIHHLSYHDKLTGLYNRAYFDEFLQKLDDNMEFPYSLIIGDMNGLKITNDTFGHKAGDELLIKVSRIIENSCRKNDVIARIGGDEFAIILPETGKIEVAFVCNKIKELCKRSDNKPIQPSLAMGYSTKLSHDQSIEGFIKEADDNMYRDKLNGKHL